MKIMSLSQMELFRYKDQASEFSHAKMLQNLTAPHSFVSNVETTMFAAEIGDCLLPISVNAASYNTSYVTSIYTAFISYGRAELRKIANLPVRIFLILLIKLMDGWLRYIKIDRVVACNNFLLSTNLYPYISWSGDKNRADLKLLHEDIKAKYPGHAIIFRSLNEHSNGDMIEELKKLGFQTIPSRQVYVFDQKLKDFQKSHNYQVDRRLFEKDKRYKKVENDGILEGDYARIVELYEMLYLDKYSKFNPAFNINYIREAHQIGLIIFFGFRNSDGVLDGIVGCYDRHKWTTAPIVGYDTSLPKSYGIYRMLMFYCIDRAHRLDLILNLSSGASQFKLLRGGVPFLEVSAVDYRHLESLPHRLTWRLLALVLTKIVGPILKHFEL